MVAELFKAWFYTQLDERGWSQSEFARRAGMTQANVSRVLNGDYNVSRGFCEKTARAFGMQIEEVFRAAGWIEQQRAGSDPLQRLMIISGQLENEDDILELIFIAEMKLKRQEEKREN